MNTTDNGNADRPSFCLLPVLFVRPKASRRERLQRALVDGFERLVPVLRRKAVDFADWSAIYLAPPVRRRRREVETALALGWGFTTLWIKMVAWFTAFVAFTWTGNWFASVLLEGYRKLVGAHTHTGIAAAISGPVQRYIADHSASLNIGAGNLFGVWQLAGLLLIVFGWLGSGAAKLTWVGYGAATGAMVWSGTVPSDRPVATALVALIWGLASMYALRGLSLRPQINILNEITNEPPAVQVLPVPAAVQEDEGADVW